MSQANINCSLDFAPAGVTFRIEVAPPEGKEEGATLAIIPINSATGAEIAIKEEVCPVLADFAPAHTRWLRTRRVTGTVDESRITGTFHQDVGIEELLRYTADICDMISQRYSIYQESILA